MQTCLKIPVEPELVPTVVAYVESLAEVYHGPAQAGRELALATGELVERLFRLAFEPGQRSSVEVSVANVPAGLEVIVHDLGMPVNEQEWLDSLSDLVKRHRVDQLRTVNRGNQGKETRLCRFLQVQGPERRRSSRPSEPSAQVEVRRLRPGEGLHVSRCVYRCYGYSYGASESVYFPERLEALEASGKCMSVVAVTPDGKVVGHLSLDRSGPQARLATVGVVAVLPDYRERGLALQLARALLGEARAAGIQGLETFAVTSHGVGQRLQAECGFRVQSILMGAPYSQERRECLVGAHLSWQTEQESPQLLYAPTRHRAMLEVLTQETGLRATFADPPEDDTPVESVLGVYQCPLRKVAKIYVDQAGHDLVARLRPQLAQLRRQDYQLISLSLPLSCRTAAFLTPKIEKLGFFFSGVQRRERGLCLILQSLHGVAVDYERLVVEGDMARELLGYIRAQQPG